MIIPRHSEQTLLLELIRREGPNDPKPMPLQGKLSDATSQPSRNKFVPAQLSQLTGLVSSQAKTTELKASRETMQWLPKLRFGARVAT